MTMLILFLRGPRMENKPIDPEEIIFHLNEIIKVLEDKNGRNEQSDTPNS